MTLMTRIFTDFYLGFIRANPFNPRHPRSKAFALTLHWFVIKIMKHHSD